VNRDCQISKRHFKVPRIDEKSRSIREDMKSKKNVDTNEFEFTREYKILTKYFFLKKLDLKKCVHFEKLSLNYNKLSTI